jgi:hypothetical protein
MAKYNITTKEFILGDSVSSDHSWNFSPNGRYLCRCTMSSGSTGISIIVYSVSWEDLTLTEVRRATLGFSLGNGMVGYVSSDGRYVYSSGGYLFDTLEQDPTLMPKYKVVSAHNSQLYIVNGFLDINNFVPVYTNTTPYPSYIVSLAPSTDAQYIATKHASTDCSTPDRVYGVASDNLATGARGKARALFITPPSS